MTELTNYDCVSLQQIRRLRAFDGIRDAMVLGYPNHFHRADRLAGAFHRELQPHLSALIGADIQDDELVLEIRRGDLDDSQRQKRAECQRCRYERVCEGVWGNYLRRYGWDEFSPVS